MSTVSENGIGAVLKDFLSPHTAYTASRKTVRLRKFSLESGAGDGKRTHVRSFGGS